MAGLLIHLTDMALGRKPEPAAKLMLPPRFAELVSNERPEAGPANVSPVALSAGKAPPVAPSMVARSATVNLVAGPATQASDNASGQRTVLKQSEPVGPLRNWRDAATEQTGQGLAVRKPDQVATPRDAIVRGMVAASARVVVQSTTAVPSLPPHRAQPLNPAFVASMRLPRQDVPPIIEVIIDRIDIRAPAAEKAAAAPQRKRREPAVALSDYLRGERSLR